MVCIVVSGVSNSGKTGSIKHAIKKFLEMDDTVIEYVSCSRRKDKGFHSDKDYLIGHLETSIEKGLAADINIGLIILSYKGKTIGFTTYGDAKADVRNNYETALRYTNGQLDLFICARHADNDVRTELDKSEEIISNIEIIPSKRMDNTDKEAWNAYNIEKSERIVNLVLKYI